MSRTVLREAMKTLAGKGLIQAKARIGTRVRDRADWNLFDRDVLLWHAEVGFDPDFVEHLHEMRMALEPEAAALAAQRRSPEQLEVLYGWVERMGAEPDRPNSFVIADLNFHLAVSAAAGNPFLRSISTLIEVALVAVLTISSPAEDRAAPHPVRRRPPRHRRRHRPPRPRRRPRRDARGHPGGHRRWPAQPKRIERGSSDPLPRLMPSATKV